MGMYQLDGNQVIRSMSQKNAPALAVESGAIIQMKTRDCFGDQKITPGEGPLVFEMEFAGNPATGPVYVKGAKPGDVLKVEVLEITPGPSAVMAMDRTMGVFADEIETETARVYEVKEGKTFFSEKLAIENKPMLGVIGTAPAGDAEIDNLTPGEHGGNMDCRRIIAGSTVYLPVHVEGALLAIGDVHAVMGDGEVSSGAAEVAADVKIRVQVVSGVEYECPMIISEGYAMTVVSAVTLDEAADQAAKAMRRFIQKAFSISHAEACMLLSLTGDLRICQVVDPLKTCRMELPLEIFKAYGFCFA